MFHIYLYFFLDNSVIHSSSVCFQGSTNWTEDTQNSWPGSLQSSVTNINRGLLYDRAFLPIYYTCSRKESVRTKRLKARENLSFNVRNRRRRRCRRCRSRFRPPNVCPINWQSQPTARCGGCPKKPKWRLLSYARISQAAGPRLKCSLKRPRGRLVGRSAVRRIIM